MTNTVNFAGVFETLSEPIAVCDDEGNVLALNGQGRAYLGVERPDGLRIELQQRETVRQIRMTNVNSLEFFLADVSVHGSPRSRVSASFHPLEHGGYRVLFAAGPDGKVLPPNIRIMESLVNVGQHVELFRTADKTLALFAASLVDVFPLYSFRISLSDDSHDHRGWDGAQPEGAVGATWGHLSVGSFLFTGAQRAWRLPVGDLGALQVERAADTKFSVSERQAFETFAQQLNLALSRFAPVEGSSESMMVGPIIDQLDAIVVVCDPRRRVLVSNRTFETMVGASEVVGRDILEFFVDVERSPMRTSAASVMASGESEVLEAHLRTATNGKVALRVQLSPALGRDGDGATGFVVTGQQSELSLMELEERMTRAEQLMNLGELATGVAHELKNPLTSILNYAEYLLVKYQTQSAPGPSGSVFDEKDSDRLRRIIDGVERIDAFVKDLMILARPNEGEAAPVNLHSVIHESAMMCEVALGQSQSTLRLELAPGEPILPGFRNQLKQVFVNLVANAAKSRDGGGGTVVVRTVLTAEHVRCFVTDDGAGMVPQTLERIFEPFFTTRTTRGGSGLGLALVQTIVQRHGGDIAVESVVDAGTTFTITLPLT